MSRKRFIEFKQAESPRWYLRVWGFAVMYWPNEPWWNRLEFVRRKPASQANATGVES